MSSSKQEKLLAFGRLLDIMDELREKCPWDKKQTFQTLSHLTIEETYELVDAIAENNTLEIKKELGDLFLHLVFYAKIGSESNSFDVKDVLDSISEKLIFRHPHIYGGVNSDLTEEDIKSNWEKLKLKEGNTSVLQGVPKSLPSLVKAMRIQEKVKAVGFDWEDSSQVLEKVKEEIEEFEVESHAENRAKMTAEMGDVFFSLINYARFKGINPEEALNKTNKKFIDRFQYIEEAALKSGKSISDMTIAEMNFIWEEVKAKYH